MTDDAPPAADIAPETPPPEEVSDTSTPPPPSPPTSEPASEPPADTAPAAEPLEATPPGVVETPRLEPETPQRPVVEALPPQSEPLVSPPDQKVELLQKAHAATQIRKRKKLDRIMELVMKKGAVSNDDVEKLLHVSNATATRYLGILKQEGKIEQTGKTGRGVVYRTG